MRGVGIVYGTAEARKASETDGWGDANRLACKEKFEDPAPAAVSTGRARGRAPRENALVENPPFWWRRKRIRQISCRFKQMKSILLK